MEESSAQENKHSGYGIASLILALISLIGIVTSMIAWGSGPYSNWPIIIGISDFMSIGDMGIFHTNIFSLLGLVFGIVGIKQPTSKKWPAWIGAIVSALVIVAPILGYLKYSFLNIFY